MRKYVVKQPIEHRGVYYPAGSSVTLNEYHAKLHGDRIKANEPIILPFKASADPPDTNDAEEED